MKVALIALGCEKNVVNSEQMLWLLDEAGIELVSSPAEADVTVINTCGFIQSAKQEAIDVTLEAAEDCKKIIVAGCLSERYKQEIFEQLPEVSGLVGCGSFGDIVEAVRSVYDGERPALFDPADRTDISAPRMLTSPPYTAYLKIAEGCDNRCSYCVIPNLRGPFRSRLLESIVEEAHILVKEGAKELILIAQDTTRYGLDLYGEKRLAELIVRLCGIDGLEWLRLHYLYPDELGDELIDVIANQPKVVKYLDIPIQHASDRVLSVMNRRGTKAEIKSLFKKLREKIEGVVIRTSLIVGFPGETEDDFEELCEFLREMKLERAGVFTYSQEEGSVAAGMDVQVDDEVKARRAEIIADIQYSVMDEYNRSMQGKMTRVLCEGYDRYAGCYFGRSYADAPEVDGKIFITSKEKISEGDFADVLITGTVDGDLVGKI